MARRKKWRSAGLKAKNARLKNRYGIDLPEFMLRYEMQGGCCIICDEPKPVEEMQVEHAHVEGYAKLPPEDKKRFVRGLACRACNTAYGCGHEDAERFDALARYARRLASESISTPRFEEIIETDICDRNSPRFVRPRHRVLPSCRAA